MDLILFLEELQEWSVKTFGPIKGDETEPLLNHIKEELDEIHSDPTDILEWIDVILLALDGAFRNGFTPENIAKAILQKHEINKHRTWPELNGPAKHVK